MKHTFGPSGKTSKGKGHPLLFGFTEADFYEDFPDGGGFPIHFLPKAFESLGVKDPDKVLYMCSGSMKKGITVDIRSEKNPKIVADCRSIPLPDESIDWIIADPPYSEAWANNLYNTKDSYPKPSEILKEAIRLLKAGGRVGLLHFQVPMFRKPLKLIKVYGITTGLGYNIRAWTVLEKE